jgi:hypothetical protein
MQELSDELRSGAHYVRALNAPLFGQIIATHQRGEEDYSLQIFTLLVYLKWMKGLFAQLESRAAA